MFPQGDSEIVNEERALSLMTRFGQAFRQAVPDVAREYGEELSQSFQDELKYKIAAQLFHHHPLNHEYYLGKIKAGQDPRILIQTGEYIEGIIHEEVTVPGALQFRVCMRPGIHQSSGLPITTLQKILEYGTIVNGRQRIPPRPHWHPMITQYQARAHEFNTQYRDRVARRVYFSL